jgi:hypothetical protein
MGSQVIKSRIVSPKEFWEFMKDFRFLCTGFGEGIWLGIHIICPDWSEPYTWFRTEESIQKINQLLRPNEHGLSITKFIKVLMHLICR